MSLFKPLVLKDSIEINTTPEKIWEFFTNLDKNYLLWHPEDHIVFKWVKGKPMTTGSYYYGEEIMNSKLALKREIETVIEALTIPIAKGIQRAINDFLKNRLMQLEWQSNYRVLTERALTIDFLKGRVGVEVQFGNAARIYHDLLKLQALSYSHRDLIDVGVVVVTNQPQPISAYNN